MTSDDAMREFSHRLFEREPERTTTAESVDPMLGLHVPMEGRISKRERSDQDMRAFVADLFGLDRTYLT